MNPDLPGPPQRGDRMNSDLLEPSLRGDRMNPDLSRRGEAAGRKPDVPVTRPGPAAGIVSPAGLPLALAPVAALPDPRDAVWRRWLDAAELAYCAGLRRAGEHLAVRALARRAVADALAWPGEVPWDDIRIHREVSGRPEVRLRGALAAWRHSRRLPVPGVSLSHAAGYAAALAWLPAHPPGSPT